MLLNCGAREDPENPLDCNPFVGILLKFPAYFPPAFVEGFLCLYFGEKGLFFRIEVVGTQDVQVYYGTHFVLSAPLQRIVQQGKCLAVFLSVGSEHLLLVDGYTQMVEPQ